MCSSQANLLDEISTHKRTKVDSTGKNEFTTVIFLRAYIKHLKEKKKKKDMLWSDKTLLYFL